MTQGARNPGVRSATYRDASEILRIQEMYSCRPGVRRDNGFIAFPVDEPELQSIIDLDGEFAWVYDAGEGVKGYLLAYRKANCLAEHWPLKYATIIDPKNDHILNGPYLYGRHIAVEEPGSNPAIPMALQKELFHQGAIERAPYAVVEIPPANRRSLEFNMRKMGWRQIGWSRDRHCAPWMVMAKEIQG